MKVSALPPSTDTLSADVVIVGAGSAGCALAHRLSSRGDLDVLLLEAGPPDKAREIHIPPAFIKLFRGELDWAYETEPEPGCDDRRLYWPRGRVLGGSSSINAMLYIRGHRRDYDRWVTDYGCEGWSHDDVLPYFKRSQNQRRGADAHHGEGGPLEVMDPAYTNPLTERFVAAGAELGWRRNADFNGAHQEGIGVYQVNQRRGRRCSAAVAYLHPALSRPNLRLATDAHALRLDVAGGRAKAVEVLHGGHRRRIEARREIVLAAGAIGSPHLLLLSGVGPADELRGRGVEVKHDLPGVGRNLQDHLVVSTVYRSRHDNSLDNAENLRNVVRYLLTRRGPFTSSVCEGGAFVRTRQGLEQPDLQFHFIPTALVDHGFDSVADHGFNFGPTLLKPQSRGRITLKSDDPLQPPAIEANYLSEAEDLRVLVEGVKLARELAATQAFADDRDREIWPGPEARSDEEIEAFVRRVAATLYHPACSCAMGPASSGNGAIETVLDPELRVHGVDGLRVADASVMPELIGGNTNAPTIMIAEKASDLILRDLAS